jgi:hypothetical protein
MTQIKKINVVIFYWNLCIKHFVALNVNILLLDNLTYALRTQVNMTLYFFNFIVTSVPDTRILKILKLH